MHRSIDFFHQQRTNAHLSARPIVILAIDDGVGKKDPAVRLLNRSLREDHDLTAGLVSCCTVEEAQRNLLGCLYIDLNSCRFLRKLT